MAMFDKFKDMIGIEDEYDDYYDFDDDKIEEEKEEEVKNVDQVTEKITPRRNNLVNLHPEKSRSNDRIQINIHEPVSFNDSPKILDSIINHKVVVLNLEMLEMEAKRQVFDFVSGGIYALKGKIQKVTKDIFIIAPKDVAIDGKLKEKIEDKGFYKY